MHFFHSDASKFVLVGNEKFAAPLVTHLEVFPALNDAFSVAEIRVGAGPPHAFRVNRPTIFQALLIQSSIILGTETLSHKRGHHQEDHDLKNKHHRFVMKQTLG